MSSSPVASKDFSSSASPHSTVPSALLNPWQRKLEDGKNRGRAAGKHKDMLISRLRNSHEVSSSSPTSIIHTPRPPLQQQQDKNHTFSSDNLDPVRSFLNARTSASVIPPSKIPTNLRHGLAVPVVDKKEIGVTCKEYKLGHGFQVGVFPSAMPNTRAEVQYLVDVVAVMYTELIKKSAASNGIVASSCSATAAATWDEISLWEIVLTELARHDYVACTERGVILEFVTYRVISQVSELLRAKTQVSKSLHDLQERYRIIHEQHSDLQEQYNDVSRELEKLRSELFSEPQMHADNEQALKYNASRHDKAYAQRALGAMNGDIRKDGNNSTMMGHSLSNTAGILKGSMSLSFSKKNNNSDDLFQARQRERLPFLAPRDQDVEDTVKSAVQRRQQNVNVFVPVNSEMDEGNEPYDNSVVFPDDSDGNLGPKRGSVRLLNIFENYTEAATQCTLLIDDYAKQIAPTTECEVQTSMTFESEETESNNDDDDRESAQHTEHSDGKNNNIEDGDSEGHDSGDDELRQRVLQHAAGSHDDHLFADEDDDDHDEQNQNDADEGSSRKLAVDPKRRPRRRDGDDNNNDNEEGENVDEDVTYYDVVDIAVQTDTCEVKRIGVQTDHQAEPSSSTTATPEPTQPRPNNDNNNTEEQTAVIGVQTGEELLREYYRQHYPQQEFLSNTAPIIRAIVTPPDDALRPSRPDTSSQLQPAKPSSSSSGSPLTSTDKERRRSSGVSSSNTTNVLNPLPETFRALLSHSDLAPKPRNSKWVHTTLMDLFTDFHGSLLSKGDLGEFVKATHAFFRHKYGLAKMADAYLVDFISALFAIGSGSRRVVMFAQWAKISNHIGLEEDSETFTTEALRFFLTVVHFVKQLATRAMIKEMDEGVLKMTLQFFYAVMERLFKHLPLDATKPFVDRVIAQTEMSRTSAVRVDDVFYVAVSGYTYLMSLVRHVPNYQSLCPWLPTQS
eukprot:PhM_4_TR3597/c0_g1_i1/m.61457